MIQESLVLRIDEYLIAIETIFNNYIPTIEGLLFLPNKRYPFIKNHKLSNTELPFVSNNPYMPYKCVEFVTDWILDEIHRNLVTNTVVKIDCDVYKSNPLLTYFVSTNFYKSDIASLTDRIKLYLGDDCHTQDIKMISKIVTDIIHQTWQYIDFTEPWIYDIEYDTYLIILSKRCNIWEYRYKEVIEEKSAMLTISDQC